MATADEQLIRPQVGLMLSCGEPPTEARGYPEKLDYIRPKPGALGQYADAAALFTKEYGDRPRCADVLFVSDVIPEVLNVRPMVFGTSGMKAVGRQNLAMYPPGEFAARCRAFDWDLTTFPDDQPEPGEYTLTKGREDPVVKKMGLKVYGTLYVSIPKVTGLMLVAGITTTSLRTMENWHNGLHLASRITGGVLTGIPFKLMLRPARSRYWDAKEKKRKPTEFHEWVLDSSHSLASLYEIASARRLAIGGGQPLGLPPVRENGEEPDEELETLRAGEVPFVDVTEFVEAEVTEDAEFSFEQLIPENAKAEK